MRWRADGAEAGRSLTETAVVILIMALVAAIAMQFVLRHRQRGYEAQARATVKNAAVVVEGYGAKNHGKFSALDGKGDNALRRWGYTPIAEAPVTIKASDTGYCITADHLQLVENWKYASNFGTAEPGGCINENG